MNQRYLWTLFLLIGFAIKAAPNELFSYEKRRKEFVAKYQTALSSSKPSGPTKSIFDPDGKSLPKIMSSSGGAGPLVENVHGDITVAALGKRLSHQCLDYLIEANIGQDKGKAFGIPTNHYDNNLICESHKVMQERIKLAQNNPSTSERLKTFGEVLHAAQDFYSHSNYVEWNLEQAPNLEPQQLELFDFDGFCKKGKTKYKSESIFTGSYETRKNELGLVEADFSDPRSHLHWNKDMSSNVEPDRLWAERYSRSALKRSRGGRGPTYFDFAFSLQVRETERLYMQIAGSKPPLDLNCRVAGE